VHFALFFNKIVFGNDQLLLSGIAGKLNYLHSVKKSRRNRAAVIRGRDKNNLAEINRELNIVISEGIVLFRIKGFKQSSCRVTLIITSQLVNFIKKNNRVKRTCLSKRIYNSAAHRAYIGLSVSANLCFITDTTERHSDILSTHRFCNRTDN